MKGKKVTIIYFEGDTGETHTIEISRRIFRSLVLIAILAILLLASSVTLAITFYFEKNRIISERSALQKGNDALMDPMKDNLQGVAPVRRDKQKAHGKSDERLGRKEVMAPMPKNLLSVRDFEVIDGDGGKVKRVSFDLVKNIDDGKKVEGYVVIVGEGGSPSAYSVFPKKMEVNGGNPINYKNGDSFAIRRLKRVQGMLSFQNQVNGQWKATIFVYLKDGTPSLRKEFILVQ